MGRAAIRERLTGFRKLGTGDPRSQYLTHLISEYRPQDATYLAGIIREAQDLLPELRKEYEEVTRLLEQEQADIDEIENSDQDYLNELKASIAEQRCVWPPSTRL